MRAKGISSHNLASHFAVVRYVHISNPGVWEILCLAMEKYSGSIFTQSGRRGTRDLTTDWKTLRGIFGERGSRAQSFMAMLFFLTIEEVIHL